MTGDIIQFPSPKEPEEDDDVMIRLQVFASGKASVWISNEIETEEQITWAKNYLFDLIYAAGDVLTGPDGIGPSTERPLDD